MARLTEPGSVRSPELRRVSERVDRLMRTNVVFFNSFAHTLTAATTRYFNNDSATGPSYDPRDTLSQQAGPPAWSRFRAPVAGIYTFHFRVAFSGLTTGTTVIGVRTSRNGAAEEEQLSQVASKTTDVYCGSFAHRLGHGETVDWGVRTSTGSTMTAARLAIVLEGMI